MTALAGTQLNLDVRTQRGGYDLRTQRGGGGTFPSGDAAYGGDADLFAMGTPLISGGRLSKLRPLGSKASRLEAERSFSDSYPDVLHGMRESFPVWPWSLHGFARWSATFEVC